MVSRPSPVQPLGSCRSALQEAMELLCRAYGCNPAHPGVLTLLASLCLLNGDADKVPCS